MPANQNQNPWTTFNDFCNAWESLLYGKDRGKIYTLFDQEREALIRHLGKCPLCWTEISKVNSMAINVPFLEKLSPNDFGQLIRSLYKEAQKQQITP